MTILPLVAGALALALALVLHPGPVALAVAALALGAALLPAPRRALVLAFAGAVLCLAGPAWAQVAGATAASDPMPWLTALLDKGAAWLIGAALTGLATLLYRFGKVVLPAVLEARLRQAGLTGAHVVIVEMEREFAHSWTPERRRVAVGKVVAWIMDRMPSAVARLKLSQDVVTGIATKMLDQALSGSAPAAPASSLAGFAGAAIGSVLSDGLAGAAPAPAASCPTCGASDAERMSRGCTRDGCPQVPGVPDLGAGLAAAAGAALAVPTMLLDGGLAPTG